jgi:hypothetical protein
MNNQQFIYWLGGFIDAVGKEGPTPEQWETIVSKLDHIKEPQSFPFGTPNTIPSGPIPRNPFDNPYWYKHPSDINKVTCEGTGTTSGLNGVIVTDGFIQNSSITRANPPFTLTTTSTTYGHVSGSTVNYTANIPKELLND